MSDENSIKKDVTVKVISDQHAGNTRVLLGDRPLGNVTALDWHVEAGCAGMLHIEVVLPAVELTASPENVQVHLPVPGGDPLCLSLAQLMRIRDVIEAQKANGAVVLDEKWNGHDC